MTWRSSNPAAEYFRANGGRPQINTWVSLRESHALRVMAAGQDVLEVGSQYGYSAVLMAQGGARSVLAVDPHVEFGSWAIFTFNLRRYGVLDRVHPVRQYSQHYLPTLADHSFGMAFIDGDHSEAVAGFDCRSARRLVRPGGGIIAVHDYSTESYPEVVRAVDRELAGLEHRIVQSLYVATV